MPLFSIVIPVKDRSPLLNRALSSLAMQEFKDFDVIVVDDNSTEDIGRVVDRFNNLSIQLVRQAAEKKGACAARNLGGDLAKGDYVAYLDSDDIFLPEKLAVVADAIQAGAPDLLASYLLVYRGGDRLQLRPLRPPAKGEDISEFYFVADQRIQSSSIIIKRELFLENRWNEALRKVQDPDFFIRAARKATTTLFIEMPLAILFDDQLQGRVSSVSAEGNLKQWLDSELCPLTDKAKAGFRFYALSHEVAKRSKLEAADLLLKNRHVVSSKTQAKTLYRLTVPEWLFKKTAVLMHGRQSSEYSGPLEIINMLKSSSARTY